MAEKNSISLLDICQIVSSASVTLITASNMIFSDGGPRAWEAGGCSVSSALLLLKSLQMDECFIKPCLEKNSIISAKHLTLAPGSRASRDPSLYNFRLKRMEAGKVFHNQFTFRDDYKPFPSLPRELPPLFPCLSTSLFLLFYLPFLPALSLFFALPLPPQYMPMNNSPVNVVKGEVNKSIA